MTHQHIGKLLPIEGYKVSIRGNIMTTYAQSLTHLYQPLVGIHSVSLYQTLLNEYQIRREASPQTHHTLMSYLSLPLDQIYEARLKLEAIGLISTYVTEMEGTKTYTYQLHPPFSPQEFFRDGMLSQLLIHHLGETKYSELERLFLESISESTDGENVTVSFTDVFDTYHPTHSRSSQKDEQAIKNASNDQSGPLIPENVIDFDWVGKMLLQRMLPSKRVLMPKNKKLMTQMVVLYDLTEQELESAVMWAVNDENDLDPTEFKSACHDLFLSKKRPKETQLTDQKVPEKEQNNKQPATKEEQFIKMLEQISPKQLLEDLSGGNEASSQDLKVIRDVMSQQGLSPGVMNVLVHYVLLKTDMKLSKAYLEKIASHWARKNVTTVRQAMVMAKSENQKYQQWGNNKQYYKKSNGKKEVIPDWFKERKESSQNKEKSQAENKTEEKEDIANLLQKYSKKKQSNQL
jgi:replication initiation and membrane attachment protein